MHYRPVGRTNISVSEIGFGCWTMGGPNWSTQNGAPIGWADVNEEEVLAGIKVGLDAGVIAPRTTRLMAGVCHPPPGR